MRLVGGSKKGLQLAAPCGTDTRPTSDRARENLFNILAGTRYRDRIVGRAVADFFAGSGAVGLEALSRGAERCAFLETSKDALSALKMNIAKMAVEGSTRIIAASAITPPPPNAAVGFLFLDPPYRDLVAQQAILAADAKGWIAEDGLIVVQQHPKAAFNAPAGFVVVDDRRYGATRFIFLEREQSA